MAGGEQFKPVLLRRLDLGLVSEIPNVHILPGALTEANNVSLHSERLAKSIGFVRALDAVPNDNAYKLDGFKTHWRGRVRATGSNVALANGAGTGDWTLEAIVRIDRIPSDLGGTVYRAAVVYKGVGENAFANYVGANTDFVLGVGSFNSTLFAYAFIGSPVSLNMAGGTLTIGVAHHLVLRRTGLVFELFVHPVGTALGAAVSSGASASAMPDHADDVLFGAIPRADAVFDGQIVHQMFPGVIQEVRFWTDDRSTSELEATDDVQIANPAGEAELTAYYLLTGVGTNTYFKSPDKGTAGDGALESPILALEPRSGTWRTAGHVLNNPFSGASTLEFNGRTQALVVPNPYLYRSQSKDDDGGIVFDGSFAASFRVRPRALRDHDCIWHYVQVATDTFTTHEIPTDIDTVTGGTQLTGTSVAGGAPVTGQMALEILDSGGGAFRFRALVWHVSSTGLRLTAVMSANNLAVNTDYTVTCWISGGALNLKINTDATVSGSMVGGGLPPPSPNDTPGMNRKYAMSLGRGIKRTRRIRTDPDPAAVVVESSMSRTFDGEMRQVLFSVRAGDATALHEFNRTTIVTRGNALTFSTPLVSAWPFDDKDGDSIEDVGLQGNPIPFKSDSWHVWGASQIKTLVKRSWDGVFDHRYRSATGEVAKTVGITGGAVYEIDFANRSFALLADGFRNDDGNLVSVATAIDGLILCAGGRGRTNFQLWKDQLYNLSLAPPEDAVVPVGVDDALNDEAPLTRGDYGVAFAFYSAHLDKWSPLGKVVRVSIASRRGKIKLGTIAQINQTAPKVTFSTKEPFDFETIGTTGFSFGLTSWYGTSGSKAATDPDWWESAPGSGGANEAKDKRVRFKTNNNLLPNFTAFVTDAGDAKAEDVVDYVNLVLNEFRVLASEVPGGAWELISSFVGTNARMRIQDLVGTPSTFFGYASPTTVTGSGDSAHGIAIPKSLDPQVTHVGYFRTVNGGNDWRLVALLHNGTTDYEDMTPDAENTGEVFDLTRGVVPVTELVTEFEGRALYFKEKNNPQRLYFSALLEPWNVPPQNVVDFAGGRTKAIISVGRTEGGIAVLQDERITVIQPTTNAVIPFDIVPRIDDVGCTSPFGIVNVNEKLYFPSENGFYSFDLSRAEMISRNIKETWLRVLPAHRGKVVAVHDRLHQRILWANAGTGQFTDGSGNVVNSQVLSWSYYVGPDAHGDPLGWSSLTNLNVRGFAVIQDATNTEVVYSFDDFGHIYLWDTSDSYGPGSLITSTNIAPVSSSANTVTVPQVTDPVKFLDGYRGLFVILVRAVTGERQAKLIVADDFAAPNSTLTVHSAWTGGNPTTADRLYFGNIECQFRFGPIAPAGESLDHKIREVVLRQRGGVQGTILLKHKGQGGVPAVHEFTERVNANEANARIGFAAMSVGRTIELSATVYDRDTTFEWFDLTLYMAANTEGRGEFATAPP